MIANAAFLAAMVLLLLAFVVMGDEYETEDGRAEHRDVELVTEHYSRAHLAGKARAGFALYRAAGGGSPRGGSVRKGGTPLDPHLLEALV